MSDSDQVFDFPCDFPIKVVGRADRAFKSTITEIVRRHAPDLSHESIRSTDSRKGNFVSVTLVIRATDRAQLDSIYRDLSDCDMVLMAL